MMQMNFLQKKCPGCSLVKPMDMFVALSSGRSGFGPRCKSCHAATNKSLKDSNINAREAAYACVRRWRLEKMAQDPESFRRNVWDGSLKARFGITSDQYEAMLKAQGGVCAICKKPETARHNDGRVRRLSVDHDHRTLRVRSLLCSRCNIAIGSFLENQHSLAAAIKYLSCNSFTFIPGPDSVRHTSKSKFKTISEYNTDCHLRYSFKMSLSDFREMEKNQDGVCAICSKRESVTHKGKTRRLSVDHCHKSGAIRGLLCSRCNTAIGHLGECSDRLAIAIEYLTKHDGDKS